MKKNLLFGVSGLVVGAVGAYFYFKKRQLEKNKFLLATLEDGDDKNEFAMLMHKSLTEIKKEAEK
jgi:uncharacterized protein YxeA